MSVKIHNGYLKYNGHEWKHDRNSATEKIAGIFTRGGSDEYHMLCLNHEGEEVAYISYSTYGNAYRQAKKNFYDAVHSFCVT